MKKIAKKIYIKIGIIFGFIEANNSKNVVSQRTVLYKIGNPNMHNSHIDDLIPQAITIGKNFVSSLNSMIIAHDASLYNHIKKHRVEEIVIGDNVFLGAGAIILPGVHVGDGAIIGAGSIVTKDVNEYTVVAGNPAKFICTVNDYVEKCKSRNVLFDTPECFDKYYTSTLSGEDIKEFQQKYINRSK